jgi:hypothetical protein
MFDNELSKVIGIEEYKEWSKDEYKEICIRTSGTHAALTS